MLVVGLLVVLLLVGILNRLGAMHGTLKDRLPPPDVPRETKRAE